MEDPTASDGSHLEVSSHVGPGPPLSSPSQSSLQASLREQSPALNQRRSVRKRPSEALQPEQASAAPLLKSSNPQQPEIRKAPSKMSLFSLFSKPNVEKQRGYAEPGLASPPVLRAMSLTVKSDSAVALEQRSNEQSRARPTSSKSFAPSKARAYTSQEPLPSRNGGRIHRKVDAPPLFQVWPQSVKTAMLEVSAVSSDHQTLKPKNRLAQALLAPTNDMLSNAAGYRINDDAGGASHTRQHSNSGISLPKKIVVLTTSGSLLQYANVGLSDRLPERILQLGIDSAAFASDLIPGRHHVLQVSHAVNTDGVAVAETQSLFSKLNLRRTPICRPTATYLLVMSGPDELNDWMTAVKKSIQEQGGLRMRSDSATSKPSSTPQEESTVLAKTLSIGHRYQVKRNPDGPSSFASPEIDAFPSPPVVSLNPDTSKEGLPDSCKIESANEVEGGVCGADNSSTKARPRASSDCPSVGSSTTVSIEQQRLDKVRSSVRISRTSTTATSVSAPSRTNSMVLTPPEVTKELAEHANEFAVLRSPYRTQPPLSVAKRRSGAIPAFQELHEATQAIAPMQRQRLIFMAKSRNPLVIGPSSTLTEPTRSSSHLCLAATRSAPDLGNISASEDKQVLKVDQSHIGGRPDSVVGDLSRPNPEDIKPPLMERTVPDTSDTRTTSKDVTIGHHRAHSGTPLISPTSRPLRAGSNSFSVPRTQTCDVTSERGQQSNLAEDSEKDILSPIPAVHTLTAKVDVATRTRIDDSLIPTRKSSTSGSPPSLRMARRASRLSLFPVSQPNPPAIKLPIGPLLHSPSAAALSPCDEPPRPVEQGPNRRLARPASLQVRTNHAPFLSAIKSTQADMDKRQFVSAPPIRSLKPARSSMAFQSKHSPLDGSSKAGFLPFAFQDETIDEKTTTNTVSIPSGIRSPSPRLFRTSVRMSTQMVDFSALGPPAPPPSAPLPELPKTCAN